MKWTASDVLDALRTAYTVDVAELQGGGDEWSMLTEVELRVPKARAYAVGHFGSNHRRIDVLLIRAWSAVKGKGMTTGHERIAVEVKVSRSDYRNETDAKRAPAWASAHRCYYAAPAGIIAPETLPDGWGLIEVYETPEAMQAAGSGTGRPMPGNCRMRTPAERHAPTCDLDHLVSSVARIGSRHAERVRRNHDDDPGAVIANLRAEVERLSGQLARAKDAVYREKIRLGVTRRQLLAVEGAQECADCGEPLTFARAGRHESSWHHVDDLQETACYQLRDDALRAKREANSGAKYIGNMYPGPPTPAALARWFEQDADADKQTNVS